MTTGPAHWEILQRARYAIGHCCNLTFFVFCNLILRETRAVDNQVFVVAASPARVEGAGYVAYGHSTVTSPWYVQVLCLKIYRFCPSTYVSICVIYLSIIYQLSINYLSIIYLCESLICIFVVPLMKTGEISLRPRNILKRSYMQISVYSTVMNKRI